MLEVVSTKYNSQVNWNPRKTKKHWEDTYSGDLDECGQGNQEESGKDGRGIFFYHVPDCIFKRFKRSEAQHRLTRHDLLVRTPLL